VIQDERELSRILGGNVREIRKARGLTQTELAARMGVSQFAVSAIENGERWPTRKTMLALCQALNTSPAVLLTEDAFGKIPI